MNKTGIEWTDYSWNPVTGCRHGCSYCYARALYRRFGRSFAPEFHEERISQPAKVSRPSKIFVCSVADLFGAWVPQKWIDSVFAEALCHQQHVFQFLTKNPARLAAQNFPKNSWVGCTVTKQAEYDEATKHMARVKAPVKFISFEPLLSEITDIPWLPEWVIIGAQTGPKKIQPERTWVERITRKARAYGSAIFLKPNLVGYDPHHQEYPITASPRLRGSS